jgi:hypothetical protein
MTAEIVGLNLPPRMQELPDPIRMECDLGLSLTVSNLTRQLGSIEAYNRLVNAAKDLRTRINSGDISPPRGVE